MLVRAAVETDAQIIAEFNQAMALETESKKLDLDTLLQGVAEVFRNPDRGIYYVAEKDQQVVACLLITYEWSDWRNGNFWWIQSVYVTPHARRQGAFQSLFSYVKNQAQQHNAIGLRLYVETENATARKTYEKLAMTFADYQVYELEF